MIIYGSKKKTLKNTVLVRHTCSNCYNTKHIAVGAIDYFHIFWIPIFLLDKRVVLVCSHCRKKMAYKLLNRDERPEIPKSLFAMKRLWPFYLGIWLIAAIFISSGVIMSLS